MMATSDNFPPRLRPEEFPRNKSAAGTDDAGRLATESHSRQEINTAANRFSRDRIVYAYMRSLRERI
jgi:hypothetical protein